jgi:hypothetical protein
MSTSKLQVLLDSTVTQFRSIKQSGSVTLPEVVKIATTILKDIYFLESVSTEEKKAFMLMALQRGLDAAGPLQGLGLVDSAVVEKHALHLAVTAVFGLVDTFPQAFAEAQTALSYVRSFLSKYLPVCSQAATAALEPKDTALIAEALASLKAFSAPVTTLEVRTVETTPESVAPVAQV